MQVSEYHFWYSRHFYLRMYYNYASSKGFTFLLDTHIAEWHDEKTEVTYEKNHNEYLSKILTS